MSRKLIGAYFIVVGLGMIALWSMLLLTHQAPEIVTAPWSIAMHLAAEFLTGAMLVVSGVGLLARWRLARTFPLIAGGMLIYTVIQSPGYYLNLGQAPMVVMFGVTGTVALVAVVALARQQQPAPPLTLQPFQRISKATPANLAGVACSPSATRAGSDSLTGTAAAPYGYLYTVGVLVGVFVGVAVSVGVLVGVGVAVSVGVFVGVLVAVGVAVSVGVLVGVGVAVSVGVFVGVLVSVGVAVSVGVLVGVGVAVSVGVFVGVLVAVGVAVSVGVFVGVGVAVSVGVLVGVGVRVLVGVNVGHFLGWSPLGTQPDVGMGFFDVFVPDNPALALALMTTVRTMNARIRLANKPFLISYLHLRVM